MNIDLRPIHVKDWKLLLKWRNDPQVTRDLAFQAMSEERVRQFIQEKVDSTTDRTFVIECDGQVIGYTLIESDVLNKKCEVGIIIGEKGYWGKGIGKQVCRKITDIAISEMGLHRVLAVASERNLGSIRCFLSQGYREEGRLRHANYRDGKFYDLVLLSMLSHEWNHIPNRAEFSS
ncbi:GNAT family protein [Bdellovibrionota bacterium FG-1]